MLANGCITEAIVVAKSPHVLAYDNIQASISLLIEQQEGAPAKVQSGTVSVIYPALNTDPGDMSLSQICDNWCKMEGLLYPYDIRQTCEQLESYFGQLVVHVVWVLHHLKGSEAIIDHEDFQHLERQKLPVAHMMKQYPLRASHIEEASVQGNIAVVNNIYISQLQLSETDFDDRVIPCINNQLTNAWLRTAQLSCTSDNNAFTRLEFLQLGFGLTGGKGWCTRLVHCKYTARTWTKYPPYTNLGTGSTFRIFQANFFAVSLVQEIPGTFTVSPVM